jgi:cytidylate kinase
MSKKIVIAIDGPAAAGKSTVAQAVASTLDYSYIDTGAMYRALAYKARENKIDVNNESELAKMLETTHLNLDKQRNVYVDNVNVTSFIRTPEISNLVSIISVYKTIREFLSNMQKKLAKQKSVVMEGRDIGSYIAPDAELKIFLTASVSARAKRRHLELSQHNINVDIAQLEKDIKERDERDSTRQYAPLIVPKDAYFLDTSLMDVSDVINTIVNKAKEIINA